MQQGTAYIPLSGYAAGLVRLSAGLYVIRCAVSHQKSIFLSSALDDTNGILALMVSSCLVPPPASCGEERHIFDYLIQVLIRIINAKFQVIPIKSFLSRALKAK